MGDYFVNLSNVHVKDEKIIWDYKSFQCSWSINEWQQGKKIKYMQFVALWHPLKQGHLMTNFEDFKTLL
jgi:hypothetical protein